MPHDNTLAILISHEMESEPGRFVFHFMHTDGDGNRYHSAHYSTTEEARLNEWQSYLDGQWLTRDEVNDFRKRIRKSLNVRKV